MLVKHNLSKLSASKRIKKSWSTSGTTYVGTESLIEGNNAKFRNMDNVNRQPAFLGISLLPNENETYEKIDEIYYYLDLENTGKYDIKLNVDGVELDFDTVKAGERKMITFSLSDAATVRMQSIYNREDWHEVTLHNYMTSSDSTNVYLPNINALSADKQPLLPPEGQYKEIQPR